MPKGIEITVPAARTDALVEQLRAMEGLLSLHVWRGASLSPMGDVIALGVTSSGAQRVIALLHEQGLGDDRELLVTTSQPLALVTAGPSDTITEEPQNSTWEEMESLVDRESKMDLNGLALMGISGAICVVGVATNALHVVIGAMLVAPGFEPLVRISLGVTARSAAVWRGLRDTSRAYAACIVGAVLATLVMRGFGYWPVGDALVRWLIEVGLVLVSGLLTLGLKRHTVQPRNSLL